MELWVRNQDRENLVKVELLEINEREKDCMITTMFQNKVAHLGIYKTKERALEVLDEIQKLLNPMLIFTNAEVDEETLKNIRDVGACWISNDAKLEQINITVYEMPKE